VAKAARQASWWRWDQGAITSVGEILHGQLGAAYKVIWLTGYDVDGAQGDFLVPTSPASLDRELHATGHELLLVDPRGSVVGARPRWQLQNGDDADAPEGVLVDLAAQADALIFVQASRPSTPLP
jgi:hypothetical protein